MPKYFPGYFSVVQSVPHSLFKSSVHKREITDARLSVTFRRLSTRRIILNSKFYKGVKFGKRFKARFVNKCNFVVRHSCSEVLIIGYLLNV